MPKKRIDPALENRERYNDPETVRSYAQPARLTACEEYFFETYLRRGMRILDVGIGGGRTIPFLATLAGEYTGIDSASEMVAACRAKFPERDLRVMDAADLTPIADNSFDAIVFTFNGIDYLFPAEKRDAFLGEAHRTLRPEGVLIFSTHNARATIFPMPTSTGDIPQRARETGAWLKHSLIRAGRRITTSAFWKGQGYVLLDDHGGLTTYLATPERVREDTARRGFRWLETRGNFFPRMTSRYTTSWFYYAFAKSV